MRSLLLAASILISSALAACSTISVSSDYDHGVNFAALKTWSWYTEHGAPGSDEKGVTSLTSSRIRSVTSLTAESGV